MFGYQEHEALGHKINMLMSSPHREFHDTYLNRFIDTELPKIIGIPTRVTAIHRDGSEFEIDICIGAKKLKEFPKRATFIRTNRQLNTIYEQYEAKE